MKIVRMMVLPLLLALQGLAWGGYVEGLAAAVAGDYATALREFRPLAERGQSDAQFNLGLIYSNGLGVPQDYVQAHKWFNIAGTNGDKNGTSNRDRVAQSMTSAQLAEAQRLARELMEKHP